MVTNPSVTKLSSFEMKIAKSKRHNFFEAVIRSKKTRENLGNENISIKNASSTAKT